MTTLTKYDWLNDPTGTMTPPPEGPVSPTGMVGPAPRSTTPRYAGEMTTTEWLNWVRSQIPNSTAASATRQLTMVADREPVPLIYGEDRIGAMVLNVVPYDFGTGPYIIVQCLWGLACDSMPAEPTYNDKPLTDVGAYYHVFRTGYDATSTWSIFNSAFYAATGNTVAYTDTLTGYAVSYIAIPQNKFNGILKFEAVLRGRRVYDPRIPGTVWSDNPSLCDADFLVNFCGKTVVWSSVATAANANDENVGGEKRRTLNVTFKGRENARSVSETLRAYSATFHVPDAAGIKLVPDRPASPVATYRHADGQIAAVRVSKKDSGNFPTESEVVYTNRTVTPWKDDSVFVAVDGVGTTVPRRLTTVKLPGINRYSQARREAWERLNRMRTSDMTVVAEVFDIGIRHEEGDPIILNHPLWNLDKPFRVGSPEALGNGMWRLSCVEYSDSGYSDDTAAEPTYPDTGFTNPALPPATPTGLTYTFSTTNIEFAWNRNPEFTVAEYELRVGGSSWTDASSLGSAPTIVSGTWYSWPPQQVSTKRVRLKARTGIGVYSVNDTYVDVVVAAPVIGSLTPTISGSNYVLDWTLASTSQPIKFYRVYRAGAKIAEVNADHFSSEVNWGGSMSFAVAGVDIYGNEGAALSANLTVNAPLQVPSFTATTIINTVIFYWTAPFSPLPISSYVLKKGAVYASATTIGTKAGDQTFTVFQESESGEFTYWIEAVDSAGSAGTPRSVTVKVAAPANFKLTDRFASTFSGTKTNSALSQGALYAPVNSTETFQQHFDNNSWSSPQAQVTAGYPLYIQPTTATGSYVEVFTTTALVPSALIVVSPTGSWISGTNGTLTPKIEISNDNFVSDVRNLGEVWEAYASNFTKVRVTLSWTSAGGDDLYALTALNVNLSLQTEIDSGNEDATTNWTSNGDTYCTVEFNKPFVDVDSIIVTPLATTRREWAVEFNDVANPTSFKVRMWDSNGNLLATAFSWQATGVI